jgi:beta-barrel assembly-enhancing protease
LAVLLIALLAAAYWFLLPIAAEAVAARIPRSVEAKLGDAMYGSMITGYEVDQEMTTRANAFVKAIDFKTTYPIRITVVKDDNVNAFALPGGNIIVFDKIVTSMKTKEEFAALLAHEVAHVHYRHSLRNVFRSLGGLLFISLLLNDINGIVTVLADNSNMLANLTYSRALETEADQKAMAVLQSDGISLKGFVDLFNLLKNAHGDAGSLQLLSTHPLTEERLALAKAKAREQVGIKDQSELQKKWEDIVNVEKK